LHCPAIDDLEGWSPGDQPFGIFVQALIGPADSDGEESFGMQICTPEWFAAQGMDGANIRSGVHTLFVSTYNYRAIRAFIERAVHRAEAETWREIAEKLCWLGHWEFADYAPRNSN
jgi:hypothetical protein